MFKIIKWCVSLMILYWLSMTFPPACVFDVSLEYSFEFYSIPSIISISFKIIPEQLRINVKVGIFPELNNFKIWIVYLQFICKIDLPRKDFLTFWKSINIH